MKNLESLFSEFSPSWKFPWRPIYPTLSPYFFLQAQAELLASVYGGQIPFSFSPKKPILFLLQGPPLSLGQWSVMQPWLEVPIPRVCHFSSWIFSLPVSFYFWTSLLCPHSAPPSLSSGIFDLQYHSGVTAHISTEEALRAAVLGSGGSGRIIFQVEKHRSPLPFTSCLHLLCFWGLVAGESSCEWATCWDYRLCSWQVLKRTKDSNKCWRRAENQNCIHTCCQHSLVGI